MLLLQRGDDVLADSRDSHGCFLGLGEYNGTLTDFGFALDAVNVSVYLVVYFQVFYVVGRILIVGFDTAI